MVPMIFLYVITIASSLIAPHATATMSQVREIFALNSRLRYQRVRLEAENHEGVSLTHEHLKRVLSNNSYTPKDLDHYVASKISSDKTDTYTRLILKGIELERQFSSSHYPFYHGTFRAKSIILRTILEQNRSGKSYSDFFLLRNWATRSHLRGADSGYRYAADKIRTEYPPYAMRKEPFRFDRAEPLRSDLLAVNTSLLASADSPCIREDSLRFFNEARSRSYDGYSSELITACLQAYNMHTIPDHINRFLHRPLGGLLVIMLPKHLAPLAYASYPFGIPVGLPVDLSYGRMPGDAINQLLDQHKETPISTLFEQPGSVNSYQARLLLNPDYFQDDAQGIKIFLFLQEDEKNMAKFEDNFNAIRSMVLDLKM